MQATSPIKTALCSFGMSGWVFHAPFLYLHKGFELYAVWERSKNLAEQKYPGIKTFRTLEDMLADEAVELVVVNTPNYTHFDYAKKALQAGKHIVVEKPFTVTVAEGEELLALAARVGKKISVYQNRRYDSDYKTVKNILDEDWLGEIKEAEIHYDRFNEALSPKLHKETPGPGTGLLYDLGSHLIDQALQFFGMPTAVFADMAIIRPLSKVEDYMEILLYYPGMRMRIKSSYLVREPLPSYSLHGTRGSFIKARTDVQEKLLQAGVSPDSPDWGVEPDNEKGLLHTEKDGKTIREYVPSLRGNYMEYYDGIYAALREGKPLAVTAEDGLNIIRIIEAAYLSNNEKRVVAL
ncbi:MAG TPA: Gfo/Idh/MocA family oxidoreductase [Chitinophagaceae bacterium]|nr:Gfo/Idh/MocA family oxidoreductase [Chitinophagaceae bacterium]